MSRSERHDDSAETALGRNTYSTTAATSSETIGLR